MKKPQINAASTINIEFCQEKLEINLNEIPDQFELRLSSQSSMSKTCFNNYKTELR